MRTNPFVFFYPWGIYYDVRKEKNAEQCGHDNIFQVVYTKIFYM